MPFGDNGNNSWSYYHGNAWQPYFGEGGYDKITVMNNYFGSAELRVNAIFDVEELANANSSVAPVLRVDGSLNLANDYFSGKWNDAYQSPLGGWKFYHLYVEGWTGNDVINVSGYAGFAARNYENRADTAFYITGLGGNDTIIGARGDDTIFGDNGLKRFSSVVAGDDTIRAGAGNDEVYGDGGNDKLYGEDGADKIDGGLGDDWIDGGLGDDLIDGGLGDDGIWGGGGSDTLFGGDGFDVLFLAGDLSEWTRTEQADGSIVYQHNVTAEEDTLSGIEKVQFDTGGWILI